MRRLVLLLVAAAAIVPPAAARAADLVVPLGTTQVLHGNQTYGRVQIDGTLSVDASLTIHAASVTVGPYGVIRPSCSTSTTPCPGAAQPLPSDKATGGLPGPGGRCDPDGSAPYGPR